MKALSPEAAEVLEQMLRAPSPASQEQEARHLIAAVFDPKRDLMAEVLAIIRARDEAREELAETQEQLRQSRNERVDGFKRAEAAEARVAELEKSKGDQSEATKR
jgi:hypothetical protein